MVADRAGNTRSNARTAGIMSTRAKTFIDRIGGSDTNDYYRLRLNRSSTLRLSLKGLTADANIALLSLTGQLLKKSTRQSTTSELIRQPLEAGVYLVRVYATNRRVSTQYRLSLVASPLPVVTAPLVKNQASVEELPLPDNQLPSTVSVTSDQSFDIKFDYQFDVNSWFTPEKRAVLDAAANLWERIILDDFPNVPAGTTTRAIINPQTGKPIIDFVNDAPIDDLLIIVGARELGGTGGATLAVSTPATDVTSNLRYSSSNFEPAVGAIAFDLSTDWFFDATPDTTTDIPTQKYDFFSVTLHEIGHALGFGTSDAFDKQVSKVTFVGTNAKLQNGGSPIPLQTDLGHIKEGYQFGGSGDPLMTPRYFSGTRKLPTKLDLAVLNDLGYQIDYSAISQTPLSSLQQTTPTRQLHTETTTLPNSASINSTIAIDGSTMLRAALPSTSGAQLGDSQPDNSQPTDAQRLYSYCGCASCLMS